MKPTLLALQMLGEEAGVRIPLKDGPRLGEYLASTASVAEAGVHRSERQQPDEGGPGTQTRQPPSCRKTVFECGLSLDQIPTFCETVAEREMCPTILGHPLQPEPAHQRVRLPRE